jgi:hypothetical protein
MDDLSVSRDLKRFEHTPKKIQSFIWLTPTSTTKASSLNQPQPREIPFTKTSQQ